uniref:Pseudouridine synthase RsuA/RluA-like domain-containing protein n=1 Tax=Proboscia inermis TaxID=420281 RepID=A0A7S0C002_9STRA|mmetsp:Transcript_16659/g.16864  ORF Transcript_16659/g.16864 Transcript_16659/m.16864 type:complete len:135 (+) Transcript_16659:2-406(+)
MNLVIEPSGFCRKQYVVTVMGSPSEADLDFLRGGPKIGGMGQLLPCRIHVLEKIAPTKGERGIRSLTRLEVELKEGKNQQIRKMFSSIGNRVARLIRVAIGPLKLESVPMLGEARELTDEEINRLGMSCVNSNG